MKPFAKRLIRTRSAFTMIEIAISIAIVGFALVAIMGVLPTGMQVKKDNREDTVINEDAGIFLDATRSGSKGLDQLTNFVEYVTHEVSDVDLRNGKTNLIGGTMKVTRFDR